MILAGRGFGKTRLGAEWVRSIVCGPTPLSRGAYRRIALVAETAADGRDVMVEGDSGILGVHPKAFRPHYEPSKRRLTWPNGAVATLFNATEPDQLRGPQHDAAWLDELAKWKFAQETYDQLQFGLRLGERPLQCITTTPRNIPVLRTIIEDEGTRVTKGRTMDNAENLAPSFMKKVVKRYEGTRLGRQELDAELLSDLPGALWTLDTISKNRIKEHSDLIRIVVSIDPSGAGKDTKSITAAASGAVDESNNSIGIIVAGLFKYENQEFGIILEDLTCDEGPAEWGKVAVDAYDFWGADAIIAETNFGGAMVGHVIETIDSKVNFKEVKASRGKVARAEPVASLYEQGRVKHVGMFAELEDQMCMMSTKGFVGKGSPDRVDALVWAITELMLGQEGYTLEDLRAAYGNG